MTRRCVRYAIVWVVALLATWNLRPGVAAAQETALSARGPRFFQASPLRGAPVEIDVRSSALLRRLVTVQIENATVADVLAAIEKQTGIRFLYSRDVLAADRPVRVRADRITVAGALTEVLIDANVDVLLKGNQFAVIERAPVVARQAGSITGRVTNAKSGEAIASAEVWVEGTSARTATNDKGFYRLAEVEAGPRTLSVRRVGYAKQSRQVTVVGGQDVAADFALQAAATQLNELVTTVTGEQRRLEVGHVVSVINADSLVREAPVSTLSDLLMARTPGLQVSQTQGSVGGQVQLQIRGPNSFLLNNEPLVIIDGVRYGSKQRSFRESFGTSYSGGPLFVEPTSPLNDINLNDIENVEVVKGPSAATLYGTDAANGVIVITTKRGRAGPARWNAYGRSTMSQIPAARLPERWYAYSHAPTGEPFPYNCPLPWQSFGMCVQDSIVALNPLQDPEYTIFGNKPLWEYGMNTSGGREDLRYYFSGDFTDATGPLQMPSAFVKQLKQQRGLDELPDEWLNPNTQRKVNVRSSVTAVLGAKADLQFNTGYVNNSTRSATYGGQESPYGTNQIHAISPTNPYGSQAAQPTQSFLRTSTEGTGRWIGNGSATWRPAGWLSTRANVGIDVSDIERVTLAPRGAAPDDFYAPNGRVSDERTHHQIISGDLGATATWRPGSVSLRTSIGSQYVRDLMNVLGSDGQDLPPGATAVQQAVQIQTSQAYKEAITLGGYLEETFGLHDRLFLTGAVRVDGSSSFGEGYSATLYPKVSGSWLVSDEPFMPHVPGLGEVRLRYAFGVSGKQPEPNWALRSFGATRALTSGTFVPAIAVSSIGNPDLEPERVREQEWGADVTALGGKLDLELTWYDRRTSNQLLSTALPPGFGSFYTNIGLTRQHGFELQINAHLIDTPKLTFDVALQHSLHRTRLVDLGNAGSLVSPEGGYAVGYPLGARFQREYLGFTDANDDGIVTYDELQFSAEPRYAGESTAPKSQTLNAMVGLFNRHLRLSALFERRTGFTQIDWFQCLFFNCRELMDPTTPLEQQALASLAASAPDAIPQKADFTRLREVTVGLDVPPSITRALRVRSASLSLSVRNLALWSSFTGPDPESASSASFDLLSGSVASGMPQSRTYALRIDLGL